MKDFYKLSIVESLAEMQSQAEGLSSNQAMDRLAKAKTFALRAPKRDSFVKKFFLQIKELMVLILLISGVVSILVGAINSARGEIIDGAIILGIVVMNALLGVFQERKNEKAIDSLKNMTAPSTVVYRDGQPCKIKTSELVLGDVVVLNAGSVVPADIRLTKATDLKVSESSLTGESRDVKKTAELTFLHDTALAERKNMVFCGSVVESGVAEGVVVALGTQTELGKIAESIKGTKQKPTPLQQDIKKIGKVLTYLILLIAGITFVLEIIANPNEILRAFLTAVAISVAAIPESLPAVITIIMSLGMSQLSKRKAIVKRMHAVETLGACDVICSDKTGTITQNKMVVEKIETFGDQRDLILKCMTLCNDACMTKKSSFGSPTELALLTYAKKHGCDKQEMEKKNPRISETPFDSKTKMMMTENIVDGEKIVFLKGAIDRALSKCSFYYENGQTFVLNKSVKEKISHRNKILCKESYRVLCFAFKKSDNQNDCNFVFLGLCGIFDPPRPEIKDAVKKCKKAGMRPVMITGDYKETALAIAKKVGIAASEDDVISGDEIDNLSEEQFEKIVEQKRVFARVSPEHKTKIVSFLQKNGHVVAMTGDGVNDAPSMKKADIGIGMGKSGTDVTKDVADILVTDDNFATIVVAVEQGRKIYSNIEKTIKYLFSANMAEILALFFITIFLPNRTFLLPVQILFVNLITDSLPAIALGVEPAEKSVMNEKVRDVKKGLLSNGNGMSILFLGAVQTILTICAYMLGLKMHGEETAITMAFYTLNLIQLLFMFTARTKEPLSKSNPFKNKLFNLSLIVGLGLIALMAFSDFGSILKLQKLSFVCWMIVLALSCSIIVIGEVYKFAESRLSKKKLHFE